MGKADYRLYVVVEDGKPRREPAEQAQAAIEAGATVLQWASRAASTRVQLEVGQRLAEVTRKSGVPLIIGGRVDVMLAIGADGVILGAGDMPAGLARRLAGPDAIVGVLAQEPADARAAVDEGADFILYTGPVAAVAGSVPVPVIAGRLRHPDEAAAAVQAGAQGVAVVAAHVRGGDLGAACRAFSEAVRRAGTHAQHFTAGARPFTTEPPFGNGRPGFL
ncbi:MAG TPA: thiamine phosphate synthase [Limnochordales bacterium]